MMTVQQQERPATTSTGQRVSWIGIPTRVGCASVPLLIKNETADIDLEQISVSNEEAFRWPGPLPSSVGPTIDYGRSARYEVTSARSPERPGTVVITYLARQRTTQQSKGIVTIRVTQSDGVRSAVGYSCWVGPELSCSVTDNGIVTVADRSPAQ
jgi:hypothetical protein